MTINKKILSGIVIVLSLIALRFLGSNTLPGPGSSPAPTPTLTPAADMGSSDLIRVKDPVPNQIVNSPVTVTGEARGSWYFEASFPVKIFDDSGVELGAVPAQAQIDSAADGAGWMTEEFVPFKAILEFKKPSTAGGFLILKKDNPSGLPEHDAEIRIPVVFEPGKSSVPAVATPTGSPVAAGDCRPTGCSGQICSDSDVVTTCEYMPEYACYKTAKCERQEDGKCNWTPTEELVACLGAVFQAEAQ